MEIDFSIMFPRLGFCKGAVIENSAVSKTEIGVSVTVTVPLDHRSLEFCGGPQ